MQGRGQINMRGKKTMMLRCGCCDGFNFKSRNLELEAKKEIRDFDIRDIYPDPCDDFNSIDKYLAWCWGEVA